MKPHSRKQVLRHDENQRKQDACEYKPNLVRDETVYRQLLHEQAIGQMRQCEQQSRSGRRDSNASCRMERPKFQPGLSEEEAAQGGFLHQRVSKQLPEQPPDNSSNSNIVPKGIHCDRVTTGNADEQQGGVHEQPEHDYGKDGTNHRALRPSQRRKRYTSNSCHHAHEYEQQHSGAYQCRLHHAGGRSLNVAEKRRDRPTKTNGVHQKRARDPRSRRSGDHAPRSLLCIFAYVHMAPLNCAQCIPRRHRSRVGVE